MTSKLEKALYNVKYTGGSYADALMSIPIWAGEKTAQLSEKIMGEKTPELLTKDYIEDHSEVYKAREKLREKLDTRPGALYLQNNIAGVIPFVLAGMPAAEAAQSGIEHCISDAPEMVQYATNSAITVATQMAMGYTAFMANEVRVNRDKYVNEDNRISPKKIGKGLVNAAKAFALYFDLPYGATKMAGQSLFLHQGKDPWKASGLVDSIAIPLWYAITIPLGLKNGIIETRQTKEWKEQE